MASEKFFDFLFDAFSNMEKVMADDASIYVFHADTEGLNFRKAFDSAGFYLSGCCIWKKQSLVLGRSPYQWQHEPCLYGWKKKGKHRWYTGRKESTIWEFDKPKKNGDHPAMKPIPLLAYPIQNSSMANSVVLDPFGGSGSTRISLASQGVPAANQFTVFGGDQKIVGIVIAILVGVILAGGFKRVSSVTDILVPVMAGLYLVGALIIVFANAGEIPAVIGMIFQDAFTGRAAVGGFAGAFSNVTTMYMIADGFLAVIVILNMISLLLRLPRSKQTHIANTQQIPCIPRLSYLLYFRFVRLLMVTASMAL